MGGKKPSYFDSLKPVDIVELFGELIRRGQLTLNMDGTLTPNISYNIDSPWHHIKRDKTYDCETWHTLMFNILSNKLRKPFVPSACQQCWKVVVRPHTLSQLFKLLDMMIQLDKHSKCGIEKRNTVHGLYGAYFYNDSFEEGLECYREIRTEVDKLLEPETSVIFKRGCTEYELKMGNSKYYEVTDWQKKLEALVNKWVKPIESDELQPPWIIAHVHRQWIEWAYAHGDSTYKEFTDGESLYPQLRTYHHLLDKSPEEIKGFWEDTSDRL